MRWFLYLISFTLSLLLAFSSVADATFDAAKVRVLFTPGDNIAASITESIRNAKQSIHVQSFSFTNRAIARALQEVTRHGVDVKVLADKEQFEKGAAFLLRDLKQAGVTVRLDGEHAAAHNKIMVIDGNGAHPIVITGSFNFTQAAQKYNAENVLMIHDNRSFAKTFDENWERHWKHGISFE
jgi:phosphatidylserine/phosphatidylglycerophosphate/cardiolipin synthase-like enzyme